MTDVLAAGSATFDIEVLSARELDAVSGGTFSAESEAGCTCGTYSICHVDGTDDTDK